MDVFLTKYWYWDLKLMRRVIIYKRIKSRVDRRLVNKHFFLSYTLIIFIFSLIYFFFNIKYTLLIYLVMFFYCFSIISWLYFYLWFKSFFSLDTLRLRYWNKNIAAISGGSRCRAVAPDNVTKRVCLLFFTPFSSHSPLTITPNDS